MLHLRLIDLLLLPLPFPFPLFLFRTRTYTRHIYDFCVYLCMYKSFREVHFIFILISHQTITMLFRMLGKFADLSHPYSHLTYNIMHRVQSTLTMSLSCSCIYTSNAIHSTNVASTYILQCMVMCRARVYKYTCRPYMLYAYGNNIKLKK